MVQEVQDGASIMDFDGNGPNIRRLVEQLQSRPGVVPFVGAGLSVPYGMPGWGKFLISLAEMWGDGDRIRSLVGDGRYEVTAEALREELATMAFNDAVLDAFGDEAIVEPGPETATATLPAIAPGTVLTTNFDHVLERVFEAAGAGFDRVVWGAKADSIVAALQRDLRFLIKIHGDVDDTTDRVLTRAEYDAQYGQLVNGEGADTPLANLIRRVLESRTVLFLGCSLKDDRIVGLLNAAGAQPGAFTHFAVVPKPEPIAEARERYRFLSERRIRPIWYPDGRHDLVAPFLRDLVALLGRNDSTVVAPLVPADEFFRPLLRREGGPLLRHTWTLVGRSDSISALNGWASDADHLISILSGRGGIGKSKLLHAFSEGFPQRHQDIRLLFAQGEIPFTPENLAPPTGRTVIVVDDAHHRDDLGVLLAYAQNHLGQVKLLLTTRPHRVDTLHAAISEARFDVRDIQLLGHLTDLTRDETRALACQALGDLCDVFATQLAAATRDSPLVTVVGGQLLVERAIEPDLLERDDEFRRVLLDKFQEVLTGDVLSDADPDLVRNVLSLVAALSPIRPSDGRFLDASAAFLGTSSGDLIQVIDALEYVGVLARRGRTIRITPDVLADHLLHRACVGPMGTATGYAEKVFDAFFALYSSELLTNLSELDWRIRASAAAETSVLDGVWRSIDTDIRQGTHRQRRRLLAVLQDVAYHQPDRALRLVEFVMRNPVVLPAEQEPGPGALDSHENVLTTLPELLRRIAYNGEYIPRCLDLLWELGRDDARALSPHPDHAMRVLADLAAYDLDKPVGYNLSVLDAVARWLDAPDAHAHLHSPLDILDPLLAKSGESSYSEGYRIVINPFSVARDATALLRTRAVELILGCLGRDNQKVTLRVVKSLFLLAELPRSYGGSFLSDEDSAVWLPDRVEAFAAIERIANQTTDPVVHLQIAKGLSWYLDFRRGKDDGAIARRILNGIPRTLDLHLLAALANECDVWRTGEEAHERPGVEARRERARAAVAICAEEFLVAYPDAQAAANVLERGLSRLLEAGIEPTPMYFWDELAKRGSTHLVGIAEYVLNHPGSQLGRHLGAILWNLRDHEPTLAIALTERVLEGDDVRLIRAIAYWGRVSAKNPRHEDLDIVRKLIAHPDPWTRRVAIESLTGIARTDPQAAAEIALGAEIGTDSALANALCEVFDASFGVDPGILEEADVIAIVEKLRPVDEIDGYHIERFLAHAFGRVPVAVGDMLLGRIDRSAQEPRAEFRPLPYGDFESVFTGAKTVPQYREVLEKIRDRANVDGWQSSFWVPKLFAAASCGFCPASLAPVWDWAQSNDAQQVLAAARLIADAPPTFVFDQVDLVVTMIERANLLGGDTLLEVEHHLGHSARTQMRGRTLGVEEVTAQDLIMQKRATEALAGLIPGSASHRFYAELKAFAEANMRQDRLRDEEEFG